MRGALYKWTTRDKYFKYQSLPTHFRLSLFLEFMTKSDDCEILANEGLQTTGATLEV